MTKEPEFIPVDATELSTVDTELINIPTGAANFLLLLAYYTLNPVHEI